MPFQDTESTSADSPATIILGHEERSKTEAVFVSVEASELSQSLSSDDYGNKFHPVVAETTEALTDLQGIGSSGPSEEAFPQACLMSTDWQTTEIRATNRQVNIPTMIVEQDPGVTSNASFNMHIPTTAADLVYSTASHKPADCKVQVNISQVILPPVTEPNSHQLYSTTFHDTSGITQNEAFAHIGVTVTNGGYDVSQMCQRNSLPKDGEVVTTNEDLSFPQVSQENTGLPPESGEVSSTENHSAAGKISLSFDPEVSTALNLDHSTPHPSTMNEDAQVVQVRRVEVYRDAPCNTEQLGHTTSNPKTEMDSCETESPLTNSIQGDLSFLCACCLVPSPAPGMTTIQINSDSRENIPIVKALEIVFEFPRLARKGSGRIFSQQESDQSSRYALCEKCGSHLSQLHRIFSQFTAMLKSQGQIMKSFSSPPTDDVSDADNIINHSPSNDKPLKKRVTTSKGSGSNRKNRKKRDELKSEAVNSVRTPSVISSGEPPKRRGRGRPRRNNTKAAKPTIKVETEQPGEPSNTGSGLEGNDSTDFEPDPHSEPEWTRRQMPRRGKRKRKLPSKSTMDAGKSVKRRRTSEPEGGEPPPCSRKGSGKQRVRNWKKEAWLEKAQSDPSRTCDLCGKSFIFPAVMKRHKKIVHQGLKPYECTSCGKSFTQKVILNKHTCDFSKEPGNRDYLQMTREEQLRKFICSVCGKRFKYPAHLTLHEMNHREERPYPCKQCDKSFRRPDHLKYHVRIVHVDEKKFICTKCGQTFKSISSLRAHEKKHTTDQGHLCNICGKSIKSMYQMSRHQKTHQDELPFECPVCGKRFKMKDYLGQHLRRGKTCSKKIPPKMKDAGEIGDPNESSQSQIVHPKTSKVPSAVAVVVENTVNGGVENPYNVRINEIVSSMEFACFPSPATVDDRLLTEL